MLEWVISSSVLIVVIILLRFTLKGKLSLRLQYTLWALVLVRLLLPVSLGASSLSVMNQVEHTRRQQTIIHTQTTVPENTAAPAIPAVPGVPTPSVSGTPTSGGPTIHITGTGILLSIWCGGGILLGAYFLAVNLRFAAMLRRNRSARKTVRGVPVYLCDAVDTPCLFGLFRPAIYVTSEAAADGTVARHAVEHELTHHRHGDHIWAVLRCVCLAIHWYNPLVWWAAILSRNDAELACDEATIRRLGESERAAYGRTLIGLTCQKRTALLNTATTMTDSGKRIKERIALIAKKPKMAVYTLVAVILIAAVAVGCTFTGAKAPSDHSDGQTGTTTSPSTDELFSDLEAYVRHRIEQLENVSYYSAATQDQVTANILDARITRLEKQGEVFGLAPNGTLEAWTYNILVKPDADAEDIMLVGGQYEEDGYFDLEGQGGRIVVALRSADGTYDILYDAFINDGMDFYGYCYTVEEAIHDWYVKQYDLDLPLYATEWIDCITVPEDGSLSCVPVHRFDGDGWYLYVPIQTWICPANAETPCVFTSAYYTGSTLKVDYFDYAPERLFDDHRKQGFTLMDKVDLIWSRSSGGVTTFYYCFAALDGGCWRVTIEWTDANITDYPYISMEPEILHLMAQSFAVLTAGTTEDLSSMPHHSVPFQPPQTDGGNTIFTAGDVSIALPSDWGLLVEPSDHTASIGQTLFSVFHAEEHDRSGLGRIFSIQRCPVEEWDPSAISDPSRQYLFARDDSYCYCVLLPSDAQTEDPDLFAFLESIRDSELDGILQDMVQRNGWESVNR